ncbi:MAG: ATP-binding protein [Steroidobacteraceae bacterium]
MSVFMDWLFPSNFMPHGHCYLWRPDVLWLHVGSDTLIAASYFAIPAALAYVVQKRKAELPYWWLPVLFAAFILLCGTTHIMNIWTVWNPDYVLDGYIKLATGIVSFATAIVVYRVLPAGMALRTPVELQREVDARTAELSATNEALRSEIAERQRIEAQLRASESELRESVQKLADADRKKNEYLAMLSHELRNPLAPILTSVQLLKLKGSADGAVQSAHQVIDRQARHMGRLLNDLLDMSRISRGRIELHKEYVDLRVALEAAIETSQPHIVRRKHFLRTRVVDEPVFVYGDQTRLTQIFANIINNACKYTPEEGALEVELTVSESSALILFQDSGIGIAPDMIERIFEMFTQGDTSLERRNDGLGIGLTLARDLAHLHGGEVTASSPGRSQGSTFTVQLPLAYQKPNIQLSSSMFAESQKKVLSILVCDDNVDAANSLASLLESMGHRVMIAYDGVEGLAVVRSIRVNVAILDIGMPRMNGYELAKEIRALNVPIVLIALTGWGQDEDKRRAREAGFDEHLTKPLDSALLTTLISTYSMSSIAPEPG